MAEQVDRSTGTRTRLRRRVVALLAEQHGPGVVDLPAKTTFYRLLGALEAGRHTFGAATTRRSLANRPAGPFGTVQAARPGELVQIDTTPLDVMVLLDDGVSAAAVDARLADAAAKPVITPETIVCDRGAVFLSETFSSACARLGISLQPAHPRTPTDKGVVERTFSSINTLFCQYVAGYTGRDPTRRGRDVDAQAVWSLTQLQDLFDQWVVAGWQPRPHDGLRHPELPRSALSPNEMYAALVAAAGYLPLALSAGDYLELLPVGWRQITAEGIRLGSLTYDCAELNPYRGQPSTHRAKGGRWAVHHDPYDLGQVWIRRPDTGVDPDGRRPVGWIEVPWIHRGRSPAPFADVTLRHTRRVLADRGHDADQLAVAEALNGLLTRAEAGPGTGTRLDTPGRRIVAKTRAAGPSTPRPATGEEAISEEFTGAQDMAPLVVVPGDTGDLNDIEPAAGPDSEPGTGREDAAGDRVVPFGVFDAHAEARRFW